jgi:hypothetical protein
MAQIPIRHEIAYSTTEPQRFQIYIDDEIPNLSGVTITLEVTDYKGTSITPTGAVGWVTASTGLWSYTPNGQLTPSGSPYAVRAKLNDGTSIAKVPTGVEPDTWIVATP